jgi:alpha-glucosidase
MKRKLLISFSASLFFILLTCSLSFAKEYSLLSPNKHIELKVDISNKINFSVYCSEREIILPSSISLILGDGTVLGEKPVVVDVKQNSVNDIIVPIIKLKRDRIIESYNELKLFFKGDYNLVFRAYNEGAAYRFETNLYGEIKIKSEEVTFNFAPDDTCYFPREESLMSHNERLYEKLTFSQMYPDSFCSLPALVNTHNGKFVLLAEAELDDYPGLWLKVNSNRTFSGLLPEVAIKEDIRNDRDIYVSQRADYIALTKGTRSFPWRVMAIAENDGDLILNQLVYLLSKPTQLKDVSWIKPGKVAWDWWNALNIYGVDFKSGVNTETYKYYIDFASKYGIEYVILDEGWYKVGDLSSINPNINMEELLAHAKEKNIGIILWVIWRTLEHQLEKSLDQFEKWGVKGIKVDFMQRDDQAIVNYYQKIAEEAAKRKMLVDFHGSYKPTGLRRAYPNVITREGVHGLEHVKWDRSFIPGHEVTIPFIRMVPGPMDYTPGAMINAQRDDFRPIFPRPMSMGTRCHQLAMYVVYESPLQMLCDNPSNYYKETECMEFLSKVPTVWDETKVLYAKVADYIALARRNNNVWYVGAMTDENPRDMELDFSFLGSGEYEIAYYKDGVNADKYGSDYKMVKTNITKDQKLKIHLAPGGGWAARIYKK